MAALRPTARAPLPVMVASACQMAPIARPAPTRGVASGAGPLRGAEAPRPRAVDERDERAPGLRAGGRLRVRDVPEVLVEAATGRN